MDLQRKSSPPWPPSLGQQSQHPSHEQNLSDQQSSQGGNADGNLLSDEWSAEEQRILSEELARVPAALHPPTERYLLIAFKLPKKTTRQVALRAVWLERKEAGKRRKNGNEDNVSKRACREPYSRLGNAGTQLCGAMRLGTASHTSQAGVRLKPGGSLPAVGPISDANKGLGAAIWRLLGANCLILRKIKTNIASCRWLENNDLLLQSRDNLHSIMKHMDAMRGVMGKMPQLAVHINDELAGNLLNKAERNGVLSPFPHVGHRSLLIGPASGSPIPVTDLLPRLMPRVMSSTVPVNIPGVSLTAPPANPRQVNTPPRTEINADGFCTENPFLPLGMFSGSPDVGQLKVRSVDSSMHGKPPCSAHPYKSTRCAVGQNGKCAWVPLPCPTCQQCGSA